MCNICQLFDSLLCSLPLDAFLLQLEMLPSLPFQCTLEDDSSLMINHNEHFLAVCQSTVLLQKETAIIRSTLTLHI